MYKDYIGKFLEEQNRITEQIIAEQSDVINNMIEIVQDVKKKKGRVFIIGIGGGSGSGSHATCDFNKIGGVSTSNLSDNPTLFTALANDEGWDSVFWRQMEMHHFGQNDCILVFSVGGGNPNVSSNLMAAVDYAKKQGGRVIGVIGNDQGHTAKEGHAVVVVPLKHDDRRTPHTENFQMILNHLIVNAIATDGTWTE